MDKPKSPDSLFKDKISRIPVWFFGLLFMAFLAACGGGGGSSPTPAPAPGQPPVSSICPTGLTEVNGQCLNTLEVVVAYLIENDYQAPCGVTGRGDAPVSRPEPYTIVDLDECARSMVPGHAALQREVEEMVDRQVEQGEDMAAMHLHIDDWREGILSGRHEGRVVQISSHGIKSGYVLQALYGRAYPLVERGDVDVMGSHYFVQPRISRKDMVKDNLYRDIVISTGFGESLNCDDQYYRVCPSDFAGARAILVHAAGNGRGEPTDQGTPAEIRALVEARAPFLIVPGWDNKTRSIQTLQDEHGLTLGMTRGSISRHTRGIDPSEFTLAPGSSICGEAAIQHCVAGPWYTDIKDITLREGDESVITRDFTGTSNSLLYVASGLALARARWPHITNHQWIDIVRRTAIDAGDPGPDAVFGLGIFSLQGLFTAQGEVRDPLSLLDVAAGHLYLPLGGVSVMGLDDYGRDFSRDIAGNVFRPGVPLVGMVEDRGILPLVDQFGEGQEGLRYVAAGGFLALRRERSGFLGGFGTGSYRLGDTWWMTAGIQRSLGSLRVQASVSQGTMDARPGSLVERLEAQYGSVQVSGIHQLSRNLEVSWRAWWRSRVRVSWNVQGAGSRSLPPEVGGMTTLVLRF